LTSGLLIVAIVFIGLAIAGKAVFPIDDGSKSPKHAGHYPHAAWPESEGITYEELKKTLLDTPDAKKAREWSQYYTAGPHLAGKNISQAEWVY
jgi:N-acetylated-alpha-linked acidic dipeptidase